MSDERHLKNRCIGFGEIWSDFDVLSVSYSRLGLERNLSQNKTLRQGEYGRQTTLTHTTHNGRQTNLTTTTTLNVKFLNVENLRCWTDLRRQVTDADAVRHGSSLSGRRLRLSVGLRRRSSSAAFCHIKDVRCETNLQQLWRQVFCSCRSEAVEQPELRQADISFQQFKRL